MNFSMDGLRWNMIHAANEIHAEIERIEIDLADKSHAQGLKDAFDNLRMQISFLCCTFDTEQENYNDMSHVTDEIQKFEVDED